MICFDPVMTVVEVNVKQQLLQSDLRTSAPLSLVQELYKSKLSHNVYFLPSLEMLENSRRTVAMLMLYWYGKAVNGPG